MHKNTLGNYERGRNAPDAEFLSKLAAIGVNTHWVITGTGSMYIDDTEHFQEVKPPVVSENPLLYRQSISPIDEDLLYEVIQLLRSDKSEVKRVSLDQLLDDVVAMYNLGVEYSNDKRQQRLRLELRLNRRNQLMLANSLQFIETQSNEGGLEETRLDTVRKIKQQLNDLGAEESQLRLELQKQQH